MNPTERVAPALARHAGGRGLRGVRSAAATAGPTLVVLALGVATFVALGRARDSRAWVAHTRDVLDASQAARSAMQDLEAAQRELVLTGDAGQRAAHDTALAALSADTLALRRLTRDNAAQQRRLDRLAPLVRAKVATLDGAVAPDTTSAAGVLARARRGRALTDSIRALLADVEQEERRLLRTRQAAEDGAVARLLAVLGGGTLVAAALGLLTNRALVGYARRETDDAAALTLQTERLGEQAVELEIQTAQLQEQQVELEAQAADLEAANTELEGANAELTRSVAALEAQGAAERAARDAADEAQARAEAANRAKSDFLAVMSHELRTPLNAIGGYVDLMQLGVPEPAAAGHAEYLARIKSSQEHLLLLITDVLNFAQIEAAPPRYDVRPVSVRTLLAGVEPMVMPQARRKGVAYTTALTDAALTVRADAEKATQVLLNLAANAIKFTPPGGEVAVDAIAVGAGAAGAEVAIRVRDTGVGIAADQLERIFEPFVQADQGLTREAGGVGLGLAISRDLARAMGGTLAVESAPNAGATFTLRLPRVRRAG